MPLSQVRVRADGEIYREQEAGSRHAACDPGAQSLKFSVSDPADECPPQATALLQSRRVVMV